MISGTQVIGTMGYNEGGWFKLQLQSYFTVLLEQCI